MPLSPLSPSALALRLSACGLEGAQLQAQSRRYATLGESVEHIARQPTALTVTFAPSVDAQLLGHTLAIERDCCSFLDVRYDAAERRLTIKATELEHRVVLDALRDALRAGQTLPRR